MGIGNKSTNIKETDTSKSEVSVASGCVKIRVMHLNDELKPFEITLKKNAKGSELMKKYCESITSEGLIEADYFGLRFTDKEKQRQWLDLNKPIFKQLKNCHSHHHTRNSYGLSFRVKHYPKQPLADLSQDVTKYWLYLQIRRDLKQGRLLCNEDQIAEIGGLILQAEFGPCKYTTLKEFEEAGQVNDLNNNNIQTSGAMPDNAIVELSASSSFNVNVSSNSPPQADPTPKDVAASEDPRLDYLGKDFSVLLTQTEEMKLAMVKSHIQLSMLETSQAECELLTKVCSFPTYGVDPYRVEPLFELVKKTMANSNSLKNLKEAPTRAEEIAQKSKTVPTLTLTNGVNRPAKSASTYLCIKDDGLATFMGVTLNDLYLWTDIVKMRCEDANFIIMVKTKDAKKAKEEKLAFKCESKSAAYSLWHWANDRKCFFTLQKANQAKKIRVARKLFSKSFKFTGTTQAELREKLAKTDHVQQPSFNRVASLRRLSDGASPEKPNFTHHATLPARIKGGVPRSPLCVRDLVKDELDSEKKQPCKLSNVIEENGQEEETLIVPSALPVINAQPANGTSSCNNTSERDDALKQLDSEIAKHEDKAALANGHVKPPPSPSSSKPDGDEDEIMANVIGKRLLALAATATLVLLFFMVMESKPTVGPATGLNRKPHWQSYAENVRSQPLINSFGVSVYDPIRGTLVSFVKSIFSTFTK